MSNFEAEIKIRNKSRKKSCDTFSSKYIRNDSIHDVLVQNIPFPNELNEALATTLFEYGLKESSPKLLLSLMPQYPGLTTEHIKSHLQKYRIHNDRSIDEFTDYYRKYMNDPLSQWLWNKEPPQQLSRAIPFVDSVESKTHNITQNNLKSYDTSTGGYESDLSTPSGGVQNEENESNENDSNKRHKPTTTTTSTDSDNCLELQKACEIENLFTNIERLYESNLLEYDDFKRSYEPLLSEMMMSNEGRARFEE